MPACRAPWDASARRGARCTAVLLPLLGLIALAGCVPALPPGEPAAAPAPAPAGQAAAPAGGEAAPLPHIAAPPPPPPAASPVAASDVGPPEPGPVLLAGRPFFCAPLQPPPGPVPFCTRSIGAVDCWTRPPLATPPLRGIADGRSILTAQQEIQRNQCWPGLF